MADGTKERILSATLDIVGERGFEGLTVRAIAERAGTSVSAVNYHFGSKDRAVAEAFQSLSEDLVSAFAALEDPSLPARERLASFVSAFAETVHRHGAALAFFTYQLRSGLAAPASYRDFVQARGLELIHAALREIDPAIGREETASRVAAFAGALLYPEVVASPLGLDFGNPSVRARYAQQICAALSAPRQAGLFGNAGAGRR